MTTQTTKDLHMSDCATHNMPASPNGECDCGFELDRYKLVPVVPTEAMVDAAQKSFNISVDDLEGIYMAMLTGVYSDATYISKTARECRLETVLKTFIKRIKDEKEDIGIMGSLVKIAEEELANV